MIYSFSVPTIEDNVEFTQLIIKPLSTETMQELTSYTEARKKFKSIIKEAQTKNKPFVDIFTEYHEIVENYLNINVDLMRLMCRAETESIELKWKTFLTKSQAEFTIKGTNDEAMAVELIMVRYCWTFAYFSKAEIYVNKMREKISTTFKANSATLEDHEKYVKEILSLYLTGWEKLRKLYNVIHLVSKSIILDNCDFVEGKGRILDVVKKYLRS